MIDRIENPKALTALFGEGFDISEVDLHEVVVSRDGPSLKLRFDISRIPPTPPSRWPTGSNTTQIVLLAFPVERLELDGFVTECKGVLRTEAHQDHHFMQFSAPGCSLSCAFSWLRVESVSGYVNEHHQTAR